MADVVLIDRLDLAAARADAEGEMVDICEIRASSTKVFDEDTGKYTYTPGAVLYSGKCKRQSPPGVRAELELDSGDHKATVSRWQLQIPVADTTRVPPVPLIPVGALVVMTVCPSEPASVGRKAIVDGPSGKSLGTAQRLNVTEVVG